MKYVYIVSLAAILAACSATKSLGPTQSDVDRVSTKFEGYTLVDLNKGKLLYEEHCGTCHKLHAANSMSENGWNRIVPEMVQKVLYKSGPTAISTADEELIRRYLVTMCTN